MPRPFDAYDGLAAAQILLDAAFLTGALLLCLRHGFHKSSGWRYILVLSLIRLVGSALRLATLVAPANRGLYIDWSLLSSLGLGPLILTLLALLSRVFASMQDPPSVSSPLHRTTLTLMLVAIVLLVTGGVSGAGSSTQITYTTISRVGSVLLVGMFVMLCAQALLAGVNLGRVAQGERRVVLAVVACLPFVLVRLAYGAMVVFGRVHATAWLVLGLEIVMEVVIVLACEAVGFTLAVMPEDFKPFSDAEAPWRQQHGSMLQIVMGRRRTGIR